MPRSRSLAVVAVSVGLLAVGGSAHAASAVTSGWWTSSPLAVAPDVGDGQLLVQGGPSAEESLAYAGISFVLAEDEEPGSLTLTVAEGSASTPAAELRLCALDAPATASAGGPADGAPAPDCATEVAATPSDDGTTYTFDVGALAGDGSLDVAVLPGEQPVRVVLEAPEVGDLAGSASVNPIGGGPGAPGSPTPPSSGSSPAGTARSTGGFSSSTPRATPSVSIPGPSTRAPSPAASAVQDEEASALLQPPTPFEPAVSVGGASGGASLPVVVLFVGLAGAAAALWAIAGRGSDEVADDPATA